MSKCPACNQWTLDYDEYFGRCRCFDPKCGWMPSSTADMRAKLTCDIAKMQHIGRTALPGLGITISAYYDGVSDALVFDFGLEEPTFDLPDENGRIIWRVGRITGAACGFVILGARKFGVQQVHFDITARKQAVEDSVRSTPQALAAGRPTRTLIEKITIGASTKVQVSSQSQKEATAFVRQAVEQFGKSIGAG